MTSHTLMSPVEATAHIAEVFRDGDACQLSAREDSAFSGDDWLTLGNVGLDCAVRSPCDRMSAVRSGAFEWVLPDSGKAAEELCERLGACDKHRQGSDTCHKVGQALDDIASIAVRVGLLHPTIDAATMEDIPYLRPTTVVSDTSGILQGALDFVVRHLHPATRIKIPAIAATEVVNFSDRFLSIRRNPKKNKTSEQRIAEFGGHMKSQGGQRSLIRIEMANSTEIERTFLLGDPLRGAFQRDREPSLRDLNISVPIREYADRLILEAAREHQQSSGPHHSVRLLTGDQGLARMAVSEGVIPLYYRKVEASDFFGSRLTGQTFDPFNAKLRQTSFTSVLWEIATAFGSARLLGKGTTFEVVAMHKNKNWSTYHLVDDLLWCKIGTNDYPTVIATPRSDNDSDAMQGTTASRSEDRETRDLQSERKVRNDERVSYKRFDVNRMFRLICALDDNIKLPEADALAIIGGRGSRGGEDYRRFLLSGNLVSVHNGMWMAEPKVQTLSAALRNQRVQDICECLSSTPSFSAYRRSMQRLAVGENLNPSDMAASFQTRGEATYRVLGDITQISASVRGKGIYPTPTTPDPGTFARIAAARFAELEQGDGMVASGAWLELLIEKDGIHPEVARRKLEAVSVGEGLQVSIEGSTTQTAHDDRIVHVLRVRAQEPVVETVYLYRGDYLFPGRSSVSLRMEEIET